MASLISDTAPLKRLSSPEKPSFVCSVSKEEFCGTVEKTKEYILDGDIFQAVISRQFTSSYEGSLLNAYRVLRTTNPSPYMVYMNIDQDEIISTSPETLVRLENGRLTTFPVAGSRPRGAGDEEDRRLEEELLADEKELSEHNMLVDLGRNDIGRIAEFGSVEVTEYKMIHKYSKIMHICSQVEGNIKPGLDGCSAVEALLPAGTLSGAPKIRACEIIEKLESGKYVVSYVTDLMELECGQKLVPGFYRKPGHMHRHTHGGKAGRKGYGPGRRRNRGGQCSGTGIRGISK